MLDPLPCRDGSHWKPDWKYEQLLRAKFENLLIEWQKMLVWLNSHDGSDGAPDQRKTYRGMRAFVGNWMNKSGIVRQERHNPLNEIKEQPKPDLERGRIWIKAIRAQLAGREPGQEG